MRLGLLFLSVVVGACSAISHTDPGDIPSVGAIDAGRGDTGALLDVASPDAAPADTAVSADGGCAPGLPRCQGDFLWWCNSGATERRDCSLANALCSTSSGVAACEPWACMPGEVRCAGRTLYTCDARGASEAASSCSMGCNAGGTACSTVPPVCAGLPTLALGVTRTTLCGQGDDFNYTTSGDCTGFRANGEDRIYQFTLAADATVVIDVRDADPSAAIDTIVYLRSVCDDRGSQLSCDDDTPCSVSAIMTGCMGTTQVRQSILRADLSAGTYYVVVDSFNYRSGTTTFRCGNVRIELRVL